MIRSYFRPVFHHILPGFHHILMVPTRAVRLVALGLCFAAGALVFCSNAGAQVLKSPPQKAAAAPAPADPADESEESRIARMPNLRGLSRDIIEVLSNYIHHRNPHLILLGRNGTGLIVKQDREDRLEHLQDPDGKQASLRSALGSIQRPTVRALDGLVVDWLYCDPAEELESELTQHPKKEEAAAPPPKPLTDSGTPYVEKRFSIDQTPFEQKSVQQIVKELIGEDVEKNGPIPHFPGLKSPLIMGEELAAAQREARQKMFRNAIDGLREEGKRILSLDSCGSHPDRAIGPAAKEKTLTFPYADRTLTLGTIPAARPLHENADPIASLAQARNFLILKHSKRFGGRTEWLTALGETNYDILILDIFDRGTDTPTIEEVRKLKFKKLGAPRLVLAVVNIGKAFDDRFYWQPDWRDGNPAFLSLPDEKLPGAFFVEYWTPEWKAVIGKMVAGVLDLGFDGVMLDDMETYPLFESRMPLPKK